MHSSEPLKLLVKSHCIVQFTISVKFFSLFEPKKFQHKTKTN